MAMLSTFADQLSAQSARWNTVRTTVILPGGTSGVILGANSLRYAFSIGGAGIAGTELDLRPMTISGQGFYTLQAISTNWFKFPDWPGVVGSEIWAFSFPGTTLQIIEMIAIP